MCRYHQLWGGILIAFGAGVLAGLCLETGFLWHCFAVAMMVFGLVVIRK